MPGPRSAFSPREKVERPADPAVRRANLRRIWRLFREYRLKLAFVCGLIFISAALGVVSPFLLRGIIDTAIPDQNMELLSLLAGGMILISVVTGAIGVVQSYLSTQVGQSVMHDLRTAVYKHLQRLSLAFFTKTRTGEVQSRIANDIGGVDNVLTSPATSVVSTVTTVIATVETTEVAVEVSTLSTPPMSFAIRLCTSPVRVRVKNASESRWRWR